MNPSWGTSSLFRYRAMCNTIRIVLFRIWIGSVGSSVRVRGFGLGGGVGDRLVESGEWRVVSCEL